MIIDNIQDELKDLSASSLISRSWLPRSRAHKLRSIVISTKDRYTAFEEIISASPVICHYVRDVTIDGHSCAVGPFGLLLRILLQLRRVESLTLRNCKRDQLLVDCRTRSGLSQGMMTAVYADCSSHVPSFMSYDCSTLAFDTKRYHWDAQNHFPALRLTP
ncbi:hypothetical protein SCP_1700880 [Sparassis crispa]|uniref:Uncharacterized protein n=1 Tax=Sparassis crispa TaxID=139825 RepID=A0A401H5V0_9APHY|nr:hypothetical protein SCP_1700880 [Sparassis crispa]GBE89763.1 hypothetical protein SCP_1700880 [Sparassis crispa]